MIKKVVYFNLIFKHREPGKEVMRVKWGRWMMVLFCVEHWVLIMLSLICEERSRNKCLIVSLSETSLVGKTERGHCKANNRFSSNVFIIVSIYLFLAVLGLCCCLGFSLVATCELLTVVSSLVKSMGYRVRRLNSCGSRVLECRLNCGTWA